MRKKTETRKKFGRICALVVVGMFVVMTLPTSVVAPPGNTPWNGGGDIVIPGDALGTTNPPGQPGPLVFVAGGAGGPYTGIQRMVIDDNTGFVGIALPGNIFVPPVPVNQLDVGGNMAVGVNYAGVFPAPPNGMIVEGDVGIGTTSPTGKLHVVDSSGTYAGYFDAGSSGGISSNVPVGVAAVAEDGIALVGHGPGVLSLTNLATNLGTSHIGVVGTNAWSDGVGCYFEGRKYSGYFYAADLVVMQGNVGIGTISPSEALDVVGNIHASGSLISGNSITIDGTNDKITASGGTINFDDENLITTGKVGIGTTGPTGKLHVVDTSGGYAGYFDAGSSGGISSNVPVGVAAVAEDGVAIVGHGPGVLSLTNLAINLGTSHISIVGTNAWSDGVGGYFEGRKYSGYFNEADVIIMDGNLGIRTESPTSALDVNGNDIRIRQSQTPSSSSANGYTGEIAWDQNAIYVCTDGDGPGGGTDTWKRASISTW